MQVYLRASKQEINTYIIRIIINTMEIIYSKQFKDPRIAKGRFGAKVIFFIVFVKG
uniref:Uncharacterized protein n=1 Tax=Anguilla anguilla TaxID=7936 RepID=A0A0E9WIJ8_ANGAN